MRYPTVSISDAKRVLESWRADDPRVVEGAWAGATDDVAFDVELVDDMIRDLQDLRRDMGEPGASGRRYWTRFEGKAAAIVHRTLELPPSVAVDHEFWLWLVFGSGFDHPAKFVGWRHGRGDAPFDARDSNYGITTSLEHGFFSRTWLRAEIAYDATRDDPYALAKRGDQDLWRSHVLRTDYGMVPAVAMALLTFVYPDDSPDTPAVATKTVREMAKELRRRQATSAFELLCPDEAERLVEDVHASVTRP